MTNQPALYFCRVKKGLLVFLVLISGYAQGQIVDDSTKQVYGPATVQITNETLIKNSRAIRYSNPDTTVYRKEQYTRFDASQRRFQSLGFIGSPLFDLDHGLADQPGRTLGINGYDSYLKDVDEILYYDTKSPFMDVGVVLGGKNRSKIDFSYTRNVNAHWNVGFDINRITTDKQIGVESQGDRQTESSSFDIYTHYYNEEKPYEIAFSFLTLNHQVANIGGVAVPDNPTTPDFYLYQDSETQLKDANSGDKRSRLHLYQQYKIGSGFQLYHQIDYLTQEYKYSDENSGTSDTYSDFYPEFNLDESSTNERAEYSALENEAGLKGVIKGAFYRFYLKQRSLIYDPKYDIETKQGETFVGTYLRFDWKEKFSVIGTGELSNEGAYRLEGALKSNIFEASYISQRALPSFMVQSYSGNHHEWTNDFKPTFSNQINGQFNLKWNVFELRPRASLTTHSNYIYFDQNQDASQLASTVVISQIGGQMAMNFFKMSEQEYFRIENDAVLQNSSGDGADVIRAPDFRYSGRLFWRGNWFQNAVPVEIGVDMYYRTAYFGNAYDPVLARFFLQDELELEAYAAMDFFVNMKIRNLRAFIKWTHFNQQLNDGYMTSPYYPGQKTVTDLGIQWLFFD